MSKYMCPWFEKGNCVYYRLHFKCMWKGGNEQCYRRWMERHDYSEEQIERKLEAQR